MIRVLLFPDRRRVENPYLDLLTSDVSGVAFADWSLRRALSRWDIVHLHWPETVWQGHSSMQRLLRGTTFILLLCLARMRGASIVETVHNVAPHDAAGGRLPKALRRAVTALLSGIQVLDRSTIDRLEPSRQHLPSALVEHGHYADSYPAVKPISGPPFGVFHVGFLRPYKGTEELIETFTRLGRQDWNLHIAGRIDDEDRLSSLRSCLPQGSATLSGQFLDAEEVSALAGRCHLCVLPFRTVENSGSVLMALSLGLPVLAPNLGNLSTIQGRVGHEWLELYTPPLTTELLADAMRRSEQRPVTACPDLESLSWEASRVALLRAYERVRQSPENTGAGWLQMRVRRGSRRRRTDSDKRT